MKGQIAVKSKINQGSNFIIAFPTTIPKELPMFGRINEERKEHKLLTGKKFLILDDIPENSFITKQMLNSYGVECFCTQNGIEAIELYRQNSEISLIITDLRMPIMTGQAFILEIRKLEELLKRTPSQILVVTAENSVEEKQLCLTKYGADEYLLKPIQQKELIETLLKLIKKERKTIGRHILIIDDDAVSCTVVSNVLKNEGHTCQISNSVKKVCLKK